MKITSLFPIPGSKRSGKYSALKPHSDHKQICEPFMGGAAKSLETQLRATLGEINLSQRYIALAPTQKRLAAQYIADYEQARSSFTQDIDLDSLFSLRKCKQSMKVVKCELPEIYTELGTRFKTLTSQLYDGIATRDPMAGLYSFCQRSCFGNVMRLSPSRAGYNVTWHVDRLHNAMQFDPNDWVASLQSQAWNPQVSATWQDCLESVRRVDSCYLLLDPPYIEEDGDKKMTPCYPGHSVTSDGRATTYNLAVEPLKMALNRGFPLIHLTNYYSAKLDNEVTQLAHSAGYLCDRSTIGVCGSLGNSNGRFEHGDRVDSRPRPIECVWEFRPFTQMKLF